MIFQIQSEAKRMKLKRILSLSICAFLLVLSLLGCSDIQSDYYEVHVIVVDEELFYYINPDDGKDTLSAKYLGVGESQFIYLYQPIEDSEFSYEHFFTTIQSHFVEEDVRTGKLYVLSTDEIDNQITQFYIDKSVWESNQT